MEPVPYTLVSISRWSNEVWAHVAMWTYGLTFS